ncbi:hypothetical protein [Intestinimonas massiliensis (ex Afouda et al. 2020)]|uniref:hypothetical protein n=1 Tax=Intestinimonas massiliensis (ex Afouda et al. 2020) TaxID=1673721 RepID=UPI00067E9FCF|nr:hypothetical protein [Intestinimonas massiliensis (ex Afouda et al. 2020)]
MPERFQNLFTPRELMTLASIVQVGDATYRELMETQRPMFGHPYFADTRGRLRTKLVQMQCEIESHDSKFPFEFVQREFQYKQLIPELRNKSVILHVARSSSPNDLPYASKYKIRLSNNNHALQRQMVIDLDQTPPYGDEPYYGILTFGGRGQTFSVVQFPEPGYTGVAEQLLLPQIVLNDESENTKVFERKKAVLKREFLAHGIEEDIS